MHLSIAINNGAIHSKDNLTYKGNIIKALSNVQWFKQEDVLLDVITEFKQLPWVCSMEFDMSPRDIHSPSTQFRIATT